MSNHSGQRAIGLDPDGFLNDVFPFCGKWGCDDCWRGRLYQVAKANRLYLKPLSEVFVGFLDKREYTAARQYRLRHRDENVMALVTNFQYASEVSIISTHNLIPSNPMHSYEVDLGVHRWVGECLQYRPKRVTSDWPIDPPPSLSDRIAAVDEDLLPRLYRLLEERHGYTKTQSVDDPYWKQRIYSAYADLTQTDSGYLSGGSV